ncbi:MAG: ABC transporter permease subunit [Lactobacillus sp.]|nr:ABC transporter permease subunit [Lactobacillus sp.]
MKRTSTLLLACFLVALPLVVLLLWTVATQWLYPALIPQQFGGKVLGQMLQEPNFWPAVLNSFVIALATTVVTLLIAMPACKVLASQHFISQQLLTFMIYLPFILPAIAIVTSTQILFIQWHLTGTFTGIILSHTYFTLPYAMQIILESYRKMGQGYALTAKSLGAKPWQILKTITWPLMAPGIATAAGLTFIVSLSQYLPTFFIGGGKIMTLPLILLPYANNGRFNLASAYSLVFLLVTMIGVLLLKQLIGGRHHGARN